MKYFKLGKKLSSGTTNCSVPWKKDYHIHIKNKKIENWWEGMVNYVSRKTMKQRIKREIEKELQ